MRKMSLGALGCLVGSLLLGQTSPFVPEKTERLLVNELSGDLAFETLRITTQWHKPSGSDGFFAVAHYVEEKAKAAGLSDVRWIDQVAETPVVDVPEGRGVDARGRGGDGEGNPDRILRRGRHVHRRLLAASRRDGRARGRRRRDGGIGL